MGSGFDKNTSYACMEFSNYLKYNVGEMEKGKERETKKKEKGKGGREEGRDGGREAVCVLMLFMT